MTASDGDHGCHRQRRSVAATKETTENKEEEKKGLPEWKKNNGCTALVFTGKISNPMERKRDRRRWFFTTADRRELQQPMGRRKNWNRSEVGLEENGA